MRIDRLAIFTVLLCAASSASTSAATFQDLAKVIPDEANALVLMDVEQILATPLAQKQGWARKLESAYVERPVVLPPEAKKLALGAILTREDDLRPVWEIAVMETPEAVPVRAIVRADGGRIEQVRGVPAGFTPDGVAFANLDGGLLLAIRPAARQFVARTLAAAQAPSPPKLSDYLESSLRLVNDRVQMLMAVDLADSLSPAEVEEQLQSATWLAGKQDRIPEIVAVLSTLRGAALRLAISDKCQGQLQIDFAADVAPLGDLAKPLVMDALSRLGMRTEEFDFWNITLEGQSILMRGDLPTDAQRRVFSLIELPAADLKDAEPSSSDADNPPESEVRNRSLTYFKSTQELVDDLRKGLKDTRATSAWMERYARRIDQLPVLHVDDELLDYGDKLAETLRIMSTSKRQAGISAGVRAGEGGGYYDGYGYGTDAATRAAERSQARKEEMAVAYDVRVQGWQLIDDATAEIRRAMTKKYSTEF
jgi:hypothetical protein